MIPYLKNKTMNSQKYTPHRENPETLCFEKKQLPFIFLLVSWSVFACVGFAQAQVPAANSSDLQQTAYQNSVAEENLRKEAEKIRAQVTALLDELKVNGLPADNITALTQASANLSTLSSQDMQKVINALQAASIAAEQQQQKQSLLTAYQGQKEISVKLKTLADGIASAYSRNGMSDLLKGLILRQTTNIRKTQGLHSSETPSGLSDEEKNQYAIVLTEQSTIGLEVNLLIKVGQKKPQKIADGETSDANDSANYTRLKEIAEIALQSTQNGPLAQAATKQTALRDSLADMLRTAQSAMDASARIEQAKNQLAQIQSEQKELSENAQKPNANKKNLADQQSHIQDRTAAAQSLLQTLNPAAGEQMKAAQQAMEKSTASIAESPGHAQEAQKDAADKLDAAQKLLDQQLADARSQQNKTPAEKLADLQKLQSAITATQQALQNKGDNSKQTETVSKLAQQALTQNAAAADNLNAAAKQLEKTDQNAKPATQSLAQAAAEVQKQVDTLTPVAQAYQSAEQARKDLQQTQQQVADAKAEMQKGNMANAASQLLATQNKLNTLDASKLPPEAKQALQQAKQAVKDATLQSLQGNKDSAKSQAEKGQSLLQEAQNNLTQSLANLQQQSQSKSGSEMAASSASSSTPPPQPGADSKTGVSDSLAASTGEAGGPGQIVGGLSRKDRDAISQYQGEKIAPEFSTQVQQYFRNLADIPASR